MLAFSPFDTPLHPILVNFTAALIPLSFASDALAKILHRQRRFLRSPRSEIQSNWTVNPVGIRFGNLFNRYEPFASGTLRVSGTERADVATSPPERGGDRGTRRRKVVAQHRQRVERTERGRRRTRKGHAVLDPLVDNL